MGTPTACILTIVFALLLSRRLGWNADPARVPLLAAAVLFALALFLPALGLAEREQAWVVAAHVATALGALVLVVAILLFEPKGSKKAVQRKASRKKRKEGKSATRPAAPLPPAPGAQAAEAQGERGDAAASPHDDPYTGPHEDRA